MNDLTILVETAGKIPLYRFVVLRLGFAYSFSMFTPKVTLYEQNIFLWGLAANGGVSFIGLVYLQIPQTVSKPSKIVPSTSQS